MAILLKKLAAAVKEYDRTQPDRDAMWDAVWAYVDNTPKGKFSTKEFDRLYKEYQDAEAAATKKLGEAMWAEPTNSNSYDHCMMIDISVARKWITTTVEDYQKWYKKHGKKFEEHYANLRRLAGEVPADQAVGVDDSPKAPPARKVGRAKGRTRRVS